MLKGVSVSVFDAPQVNNDEEEQHKYDKAAIDIEDLESKLLEMPERKHIDALLDISEQSFMRDLEPHEWHCYPGWEHAVHGWDRVSPLCCVMMNQKGQDMAKQKEAESPATSGTNRTPPKVGSTASLMEQHCKPNTGQPNVKEAASPNHQLGPQDQATSPRHSATQKSVPGSSEKKWVARETSPVLRHTSQSSPPESKSSKAQKHTVRHDVTMVPIKNFKFLPPISSLQKDNKGKKTADAKSLCRLEKGIKATRTGLNATANLERPVSSSSSNDSHQQRQQSPNLSLSGCVSVPNRRKSSISPRMDTLHPTVYSLGKNMPRGMIQPLVPAKSLLI
ncbi:uncharacterized protein LOC103136607 isoform X1 [Poecilia formosa]|uniref:uncharacterized protein LOC103136607 isoform X1 n=2 Tax=Poecilia formosa TaxID=48698 RepID=UPI000443B78C|nr:PREDICTED: uncharacterized protein LOC103136607 isoform X1 [Poecilia formosa]